MSDVIKYELKGVKEIQEMLSGLPPKMNAKILQSIHRKTAKKFVLESLLSSTPYSSETKSGFVVLPDREDPTAVYAGPSSDVFWVRYVERGTKQRTTNKGYNRGMITGKSTIEPIVEGQIDPMINYINNEYGNEIDKFITSKIKRLNKK